MRSVNPLIPLGDQPPYDRSWTPLLVSRVRGSPAAAARCGASPNSLNLTDVRGAVRLDLLKVKADLERELEDFSLNCTKCGLDVHWVSGLGVTSGHWAHREPAPHGEPAV